MINYFICYRKISCMEKERKQLNNKNIICSRVETQFFFFLLQRKIWGSSCRKNRQTIDAKRCLSFFIYCFSIRTHNNDTLYVSRAASFNGTININSVMSSFYSCHLVFCQFSYNVGRKKCWWRQRRRKKKEMSYQLFVDIVLFSACSHFRSYLRQNNEIICPMNET